MHAERTRGDWQLSTQLSSIPQEPTSEVDLQREIIRVPTYGLDYEVCEKIGEIQKQCHEEESIQDGDRGLPPGDVLMYISDTGGQKDILGFLVVASPKQFLEKKMENYPEPMRAMARFLTSNNISKGVCYVGSVAVSSEAREKGIATKLYQKVASEDIFAIVGTTKNPAAVRSRSKALSDEYVTWCGGGVVTEDSAGALVEPTSTDQSIHDVISALYLGAKGQNPLKKVVVYNRGQSSFFNNVPDVNGFSEPIRNAFGNLIRLQEQANCKGTGKKYALPLISIRKTNF
jgi:hypothetical protein